MAPLYMLKAHPTMKRSIGKTSTRHWCARALAALACAAVTASALAHSRLLTSTPANGATLEAAPSVLRLVFNEQIEAGFTAVTLTGSGGTPIATPHASLDPTDAKAVVLPLPTLPSGAYRAHWATMGHDGHRVTGDLGFSVK